MTPEEHEQYIANLERQANENLDALERDKRFSDLIMVLFLLAIGVGLLCYFL